jgi:hypothetical protein
MSIYSQGYNAQQQQQNLQFFPTNFETPAYRVGGQNVAGTMSPPGASSSYSYGVDSQRERLSTGLLAALGTSGYPGEPPLLEGMHCELKT